MCPRVGAHKLLLTALEIEKSIYVARDLGGGEVFISSLHDICFSSPFLVWETLSVIMTIHNACAIPLIEERTCVLSCFGTQK